VQAKERLDRPTTGAGLDSGSRNWSYELGRFGKMRKDLPVCGRRFGDILFTDLNLYNKSKNNRSILSYKIGGTRGKKMKTQVWESGKIFRKIQWTKCLPVRAWPWDEVKKSGGNRLVIKRQRGPINSRKCGFRRTAGISLKIWENWGTLSNRGPKNRKPRRSSSA